MDPLTVEGFNGPTSPHRCGTTREFSPHLGINVVSSLREEIVASLLVFTTSRGAHSLRELATSRC